MARRLKRPISPQSAVSRAVTRKARPFGTGGAGDQTRRLEAAYGRQGTAERLGVSERTLRRWRAGGRPSRAHAERLAEETRTSAEVRRQALSPRREARQRSRGAYVRMSGQIGAGSDPKYRRRRVIGATSPVHLSGDQMAGILDAYAEGDDESAAELLRQALDEEYAPGASFGDLESLEFLRDDPTS
jgi:transcriptional regulator with XRE-family HTH domain